MLNLLKGKLPSGFIAGAEAGSGGLSPALGMSRKAAPGLLARRAAMVGCHWLKSDLLLLERVLWLPVLSVLSVMVRDIYSVKWRGRHQMISWARLNRLG